MKLKKYLLATTLVGLGSVPSIAADLAARPYTKAPALAAVYDWTGFYIGVNAGVGLGRDRLRVLAVVGSIEGEVDSLSRLDLQDFLVRVRRELHRARLPRPAARHAGVYERGPVLHACLFRVLHPHAVVHENRSNEASA